MLITRFSLELTRYQRKDFSNILNLINKKYNLNADYNHTYKGENLTLSLPTTDADIRSMYLSGRHSVVKNLPIPKVECIENHSFCSIRSCLTDFLMSGKLPPKIKRNPTNGDSMFNIEESVMAIDIADRIYMEMNSTNKEDIIIMLGILWSDDFDPNSSLKSDRGLPWVITLTLISDDKKCNDETNTYIISLGHIGCDRYNIEQKIVSELKELTKVDNNYFYSSALKKKVKVYFQIMVSLGDQPERRQLNYIMNGNSLYGSRYGYAYKTIDLMHVLPSCEKCKFEIMNGTINEDASCNTCLRWNIMSNRILSSTEPQKNYSKSKLEDQLKLRPIELD